MSRPRRGDVWWVDFDPIRGQEINKTRPVVVVSEDGFASLAVKVVVPLTTMTPTKRGQPWLVPVKATVGNGLRNESAADAMQVGSVSLNRFGKLAGRMSSDDLNEVVAAVALVVGS